MKIEVDSDKWQKRWRWSQTVELDEDQKPFLLMKDVVAKDEVIPISLSIGIWG
jgi:hypothetical protein